MVLAGLWLVKANALAPTAHTWHHMLTHSVPTNVNAMNAGRSVRARSGKGAEDRAHAALLDHDLQVLLEAEEVLLDHEVLASAHPVRAVVTQVEKAMVKGVVTEEN